MPAFSILHQPPPSDLASQDASGAGGCPPPVDQQGVPRIADQEPRMKATGPNHKRICKVTTLEINRHSESGVKLDVAPWKNCGMKENSSAPLGALPCEIGSY